MNGPILTLNGLQEVMMAFSYAPNSSRLFALIKLTEVVKILEAIGNVTRTPTIHMKGIVIKRRKWEI